MFDTHLEGQTLRSFAVRRIEGVSTAGCTFQGVAPAPAIPGDWNMVRDCAAINAVQYNAAAKGTAFERCRLDGLKRGGPMALHLAACVFDQVSLEGKLAGIKLTNSISIFRKDVGVQAAWDRAISRHYEHVEWALDICEAKFTAGVTLECLPGHLIRRDPGRQVLVRRASLADGRWRQLPRKIALDWFLKHSPFDSVVLVGRATSDHRQGDLDDLNRLRDEGIADP